MFPDFKSSFSIYSYTVLTSIFNQFPTIPDPYHALNGLRKYAILVYTYIKIIEFAISSTNLPFHKNLQSFSVPFPGSGLVKKKERDKKKEILRITLNPF